METKTVKMDEIIRLPEVQVRASVSKSTVSEYAELIGEGVHFDAIDVFLRMTPEGQPEYILADGWHRFLAREERGLKNVEVNVHESESDPISEAIEFSCERNTRHGLKMSNADKRNAIKVILSNVKLRRKSDRAISKMVSVSPQLVSDVRKEMDEAIAEEVRAAKRKKAKAVSRESPGSDEEEGFDDQAERFKTFKNWAKSGYIEWPHIIETFASMTHFPVLLPKKDVRIELTFGDSVKKFKAESIEVKKKADVTILGIVMEKTAKAE